MTKLSPNERKEFLKIFEEDLLAINGALAHQIESIWDKARSQILKESGQDELLRKKADLITKREKIVEEIHQIETALRSKPLTKQQIIEMGGKVNDYDRATGANFHGVPIESYFEYQIAGMIKEHLDLNAPAKFVSDLSKSCIRELTMEGTFEKAQEVYEKFYKLDFRKYGVDIPPRLDEMATEKELLQRTQQLMVDHKTTLSATCMGCGVTEADRDKPESIWFWFKVDWRKGKGICSECRDQKHLLDDPKIDVEKKEDELYSQKEA